VVYISGGGNLSVRELNWSKVEKVQSTLDQMEEGVEGM
jgi:hypothetical protein